MKANLNTFLTEKPPFYDSTHRVVKFEVQDEMLVVVEKCDDWFGVYMTISEVGNLITWLTEAKVKMEAAG